MQQPAWGRSREFEITTRSAGRLSLNQSTTGDLEDDEEIPEDEALVHGRRKRKVAFMPSLSKYPPSTTAATGSGSPVDSGTSTTTVKNGILNPAVSSQGTIPS